MVISAMKKILIFISLVAIFLSTIISLPIVFSRPVSALTADQMSTTQKIQSYSYFYGLAHCIKSNRLHNEIPSSANPQQFFSGSLIRPWGADNDIVVGFFVDNQDGKRRCGNAITSALNLWGYQGNYHQFLTDIGYRL